MDWAVPNQSTEESTKIIQDMIVKYGLKEDFTLGIFSPDAQELWGATGFHLREGPLKNGSAEIGMWIRKEKAHQGLGAQILRTMIQWGFSEWPWERLSWRCDIENKASQRTAEKAGMLLEGCLKSHRLKSDGTRSDTLFFSVLRRNNQS